MAANPTKTANKLFKGPELTVEEYDGVSQFVQTRLSSVEKGGLTDVVLPIKNPRQQSYHGPIKIFSAKKTAFDEILTQLKGLEGIKVTNVQKSAPKLVNPQVSWAPALENVANGMTKGMTDGMTHGTNGTTNGITNGAKNDTAACAKNTSATAAKQYAIELHIFSSKFELEVFRREKINEKLWTLLGSFVSKLYGLTLKDHALYVRLADVERGADGEKYKQVSTIKVTHDAEEILTFLGMETKTYTNPEKLRTWDELMEYAITCRFFKSANVSQPHGKKIGIENVGGQGSEADVKKMSLFNYWTLIYIQSPGVKLKLGTACGLTRQDVLNDLKKIPDFNAQFELDQNEAIRQKNEIKMWKDLHTSVIPELVKDIESKSIVKGSRAVIVKNEHKSAVEGLRKLIRKGTGAFTYGKDSELSFPLSNELASMKQAFDSATNAKEFARIVETAKANWPMALAVQKAFGPAKNAKIRWDKKTKKAAEEEKNWRKKVVTVVVQDCNHLRYVYGQDYQPVPDDALLAELEAKNL